MKPVQHQEIKGLQLLHGQVVIITGQWSEDWYHGRVPNGTDSRVFPCDHVRIIKYEVSQSIHILCLNFYPGGYTVTMRIHKILGTSFILLMLYCNLF